MAELIDKGALKEMFPCNGEGSWTYNVTAKAYIDSLPTTTEAQIRNKAINEFFDELQKYEKDDWLKLKMLSIYHIAEQLKEE